MKSPKKSGRKPTKKSGPSRPLPVGQPATEPETAVAVERELTPAELELASVWAKRNLERRARRVPALKWTADGTRLSFDPALPAALLWSTFAECTGTPDEDVASQMLNRVSTLAGNGPGAQMMAGAMLGNMTDIAPRDGIEGMLALQMASVHHVAMNALEQATLAQQLPIATYHHNQAARLMRLFTLQVEALQKYRGKGPSEQKVTVEHVHVHAGGQAIVGSVEHHPGAAGEGHGE